MIQFIVFYCLAGALISGIALAREGHELDEDVRVIAAVAGVLFWPWLLWIMLEEWRP